MRKTVVAILFSAITCSVSGQQLSELYYAENPVDDVTETIRTDTMLFFRPVVADADFHAEARYAFGFVACDHRFEYDSETDYMVGNNRLRNPFSRSADYTTLGILRRAPSLQLLRGSDRARPFAFSGRSELFDMHPLLLPEGGMFKTIYAQRGYCVGGVGSYVVHDDNVGMALSVGGRAGNDRNIRGVSTDELFASIAVERLFADSSRLNVVLLGGYSLRGGRSSSTAEVYALAGDPYYNPTIGTMNGRRRNSRVTAETAPLAEASYGFRLFGRKVTASLLLQAGRQCRSAIGWYDAPSPMPDYYACLPSALADAVVADAVRDVWRTGDERYTTLCWDELCRVNRLSGGEAKYIFYDRVERRSGGEFTLSAERAEHNGVTISYGLAASLHRSRYSKFMRDLLGGDPISDVDAFVGSEERVGESVGNNTLDDERKIACGDSFGYDYSLRRRAMDIFTLVRYRKGRFDSSFGAEIGSSHMQREGYFRKESSPEGYEAGREMNFTNVALKGDIRYRPNGHANLSATLFYRRREPLCSDLLRSPEASNDIVPVAVSTNSFGGESSYLLSTGGVRASVTVYGNYTWDRIETIRFYNDLAKCYVDMMLSGMNHLRCGVETALGIRLSERIELTALFAAGTSRYTSPIRVDMADDAFGRAVSTSSRADVTGTSASSSPEMTVSLRLGYSTRSGWRLNIEGAAAALRTMAVNPFFFTPQVASAAAVSDTVAEFTSEERLPAAAVLNLSVYRRFILATGSVTLSVQLRNLTDTRTIYGAYRPSRIRITGTEAARSYTPFDRKFTYASPRNLYIALGYEF